jgi:hypothetical protein
MSTKNESEVLFRIPTLKEIRVYFLFKLGFCPKSQWRPTERDRRLFELAVKKGMSAKEVEDEFNREFNPCPTGFVWGVSCASGDAALKEVFVRGQKTPIGYIRKSGVR